MTRKYNLRHFSCVLTKVAPVVVSVFILALVSTSCVTRKACERKYPPQIKETDSNSYTEFWEHHKIGQTIPGDSAFYKMWIECQKDKSGNWKPIILSQETKQGSNIDIRTEFKDRYFYLTAKIDSLTVFWDYWDKHVKEKHFKYVVKSYPVKTPIPGFINFLAWSGGILWILLTLYALYKLFLYYRKVKPF